MSPGQITGLLWRSTGIVAVGLVLITCGALMVRRRWPYAPVRVATVLILAVSFLASSFIVDALLQASVRRRLPQAEFVICVLPGYLNLWAPAALSAVVGMTIIVLSNRRANG
jgi:hypothetical protein